MDKCIVGVDEAGRGALAGPVTAGACHIREGTTLHHDLTDSKKISEDKRVQVYEWIKKNCICAFCHVDNTYIDTNGILAATELAMQQAVAKLQKEIQPTYLLIDGRDKFWFDFPHSSIIKGDEKEPAIAAASIVAKVERDRFMSKKSTYSNYHFSTHKGYGTSLHFEMIQKHGVSPLHRKTFLVNFFSNKEDTNSK